MVATPSFSHRDQKGSVLDPQTSPCLHKRSKKWSRSGPGADFVTEGCMYARTWFFWLLYTIAPKGPFKYDVSMILEIWTPPPPLFSMRQHASALPRHPPPERQHQHGIALVEYRVTKLCMLFVSFCAPYLLFSFPLSFLSFSFASSVWDWSVRSPVKCSANVDF